jgi:hypothetical protein
MFTPNKLVLTAAAMFSAFAQGPGGAPAPAFNGRIDFEANSPVVSTSQSWQGSTAQPRAGALVINVHASLVLKNIDKRRIRGITLVVAAQQDIMPGGKGSVSLPALDVGPGDTFPVKVDVSLLRPFQQGSGPLVDVRLDGVLFDDLSFYGPNKLKSKRALTIWELEARRDRQHFRNVLERAGADGLKLEMASAMQRQSDRQQVGLQMVRGGRVTNAEIEKKLQFAFLKVLDSPVEPLAGNASVSGNEARAPWFDLRNRSAKAVNHVEMGWIIRDGNGRQFMAGAVSSDSKLAPGQRTQITQDTLVRFKNGTEIGAMSGFVQNVEFGDETVWVPSREALEQPGLRGIVAPSPEETRLVRLYSHKGVEAVIEELKRRH